MSTHAMSAHASTGTAEAVVNAFLDAHRSCSAEGFEELFTTDAVLDLNVPRWRFQVGGAHDVGAAFAATYPGGFRVLRTTSEPTPRGAVVEYDGWDIAHDQYYRHLGVVEVDDVRIRRLTFYCTGGWDPTTLERQRHEAP